MDQIATRPRTKRPELRRDQLLDVAEQLFATKGYTDTTVADIADAAGVAKGTFYLYFPSKEHCLVALKERLAQGLVERFVAAIDRSFEELSAASRTEEQPAADLQSLTRRLLDESFGYALEHADLLGSLLHRGNTIEIDQSSLAAERAITECITQAITRLNEMGLASVTHPAQTSRILFLGIHWALDQALCRERTRDLSDLKEAAVEVVTRALGSRSE